MYQVRVHLFTRLSRDAFPGIHPGQLSCLGGSVGAIEHQPRYNEALGSSPVQGSSSVSLSGTVSFGCIAPPTFLSTASHVSNQHGSYTCTCMHMYSKFTAWYLPGFEPTTSHEGGLSSACITTQERKYTHVHPMQHSGGFPTHSRHIHIQHIQTHIHGLCISQLSHTT